MNPYEKQRTMLEKLCGILVREKLLSDEISRFRRRMAGIRTRLRVYSKVKACRKERPEIRKS